MRRSTRSILLPILCGLTFGAVSQAAPPSSIAWHDNYVKARAIAAVQGRPLLVIVIDASSDTCRKWTETTFRDPAVIATVQRDFVAVRLDTATSSNYIKQLNLQSVPVTIFAASNGSILSGLGGCPDASTMVGQFEMVLPRLRKARVPAAVPVSRGSADPRPVPVEVAKVPQLPTNNFSVAPNGGWPLAAYQANPYAGYGYDPRQAAFAGYNWYPNGGYPAPGSWGNTGYIPTMNGMAEAPSSAPARPRGRSACSC